MIDHRLVAKSSIEVLAERFCLEAMVEEAALLAFFVRGRLSHRQASGGDTEKGRRKNGTI